MAEPLRVNRCLRDKAMDHIDHALGRPLDPMQETYRNHFATTRDSDEAKAFRTSPHWSEASSGDAFAKMSFFYVTDEGRKALRDHLVSIGDQHRAFNIEFMGHTTAVAGTSRGNARWRYFLDLSDSWSELSFAKFCKGSRVTLASNREPAHG